MHNKWKREHDYLLKRFRDILATRKKKGESNIKGIFYDSSKFQLFTKVIETVCNDEEFEEPMEVDSDDSGHEQTPKKGPGRPEGPTKTWDELTTDRKLKRSQTAYNAFLKFCKDEGIPADKGLFYMGRRHYLAHGTEDYNFDKGTIFNEIYKGNKEFAFRHTLTAKQGKYLSTSLELGRDKWQTLRKFLDPFLGLPSPDKLRIFQNQTVPKYEPTINEGLWLPLTTLVKVHTQSTIEELSQITEEQLEHISEHGVEMVGDGGLDGSGHHSKFR